MEPTLQVTEWTIDWPTGAVTYQKGRWLIPSETAIRSVKLRCSDRPEWYAVLHRCTKQNGSAWQCSMFDAEGAFGDSAHDTAEGAIAAALDGYLPHKWTLEAVNYSKAP